MIWWTEEFMGDRTAQIILLRMSRRAGFSLADNCEKKVFRTRIGNFLSTYPTNDDECPESEILVRACLHFLSGTPVSPEFRTRILRIISREQRELREEDWDDNSGTGRSTALSVLRQAMKADPVAAPSVPHCVQKRKTAYVPDMIPDVRDAVIIPERQENNDDARRKRSEITRRGNITRGADRRSEITARGNQTRGPERRREISLKAAATLRTRRAEAAASA